MHIDFSQIVARFLKTRTTRRPSRMRRRPQVARAASEALETRVLLAAALVSDVTGGSAGTEITGTVYEDFDSSGTRNNGENGLPGWTVFLDLDESGTLSRDAEGNLEPSAVTNQDGDFAITHLQPGTYRLAEVVETGWKSTAPAFQYVTVTQDHTSKQDFHNFAGGTIEGFVWNDVNQNGSRDGTAADPGLSGWTVYLDLNTNLELDPGEPSTITDANGFYQFTDVPPESYEVAEVLPAGWSISDPYDIHQTASVQILQTSTQDFANFTDLNGSIQGNVWNDLNANGVREAEPGLENWTIFLDVDNDGLLDAGELSTLTDANGDYAFISLPAGDYEVTEVLPDGWFVSPTFDTRQTVAVNANEVSIADDFANFTFLNGSISGTVWNDLNRDGIRETDLSGAYTDPGLVGWKVFLDLNRNKLLDAGEPDALTDASGRYLFADLQVGEYEILEILPSGWETTIGYGDNQAVTVFSGSESVAGDFANFNLLSAVPGSVSGSVWNDLNGNGIRDVNASTGVFLDPGLASWQVFVDINGNGGLDAGEPTATSAADGSYTITGVTPGTVTIVEIAQAGWSPTAPSSGAVTFALRNAENASGFDFGNFARQEGVISGTVFADANKSGTREAGERGLDGLTVYLDTNDNAILDAGEPQTVTSADLFFTPALNEAGTYRFTHLPAGTYVVRTILPETLSATPLAERSHTVTLATAQTQSGVDTAAVFRANEIHGQRFDDQNGNHLHDDGEPVVVGGTVYLDLDRDNLHDVDEPTATTGSDGSYAFTDLTPGAYVVRAELESGESTTYPETTGGILWPAGVSNPAVGNVTPGSIEIALAEGESHHETCTITLPGTGALTNMVDVFLLFDDTGSFTYNSPIVRDAFPTIISQLQTALPGVDLGFGVGRFEEYADFAWEYSTGRPFILNQPIVAASTAGYQAAIQAALDRTTPGYGGDQPETDIEALYQLVTGLGFDGNNNGSVLDSGVAGLASTQLNPGNSGDVPSFASFQADTLNGVLPAAGNVGGAGFRAGALPIILTATDTGFAYQPKGETSVTGLGGLTLPISALTETSRNTTPFNSGAGLQQTVTALNALGAMVIGLGTNTESTLDPRMGLEALSQLTGAVNRSTSFIDNGTGTPIAPGDPLYFQIASGFGPSVAEGVANAIQNAVTNVAVDISIQASDPRVRIVNHSGTAAGIGSGQTATFDIEFIGDGVPHRFDLQFVRAGTNVVLGSIPVVIGTPVPGDGYEFEDLCEGEIHHSVDFGTLASTGLTTPTLAISAGTVVYDGLSHPVSATATDGSGNAVSGTFTYTYNGFVTPPTQAGTYDVVASFTSSDPGFGSATTSATLTISRAATTLDVTAGTVTFDGLEHAAGAAATGLGGVAVSGTITFTYNGSATLPSQAGTYDVVATFTSSDSNYSDASGTATLTIAQATPAVVISAGTVTHDGAAHAATAVATGIGGAVVSGSFTITYNGSATVPTEVGVYTVVASFISADSNYTNASNTATLTIVAAGPVAPSDIVLGGGTLTQTKWSNSRVGALSAVDLNSGDTFRYSLVTGTGSKDNSKFSISGSDLRFRTAVTAPAGTVYSIRVRATDQTGRFTDKVLSVTVVAGDLSTVELALEGGSVAQTGWLHASAGVVTSSHVLSRVALVGGVGATNNALFQVTGSQLFVKGAVSDPAGTTWSVRLRATDVDGQYLDLVAPVVVTAGDTTAPAAPLTGGVLAENAGANALAGTLPASLASASGTVAYAFVSGTGGTDNARFAMSGTQILARASFNYELKNLYSIRVRVTDATGKYFDQVYAIQVTNVNEKPTALSLSTTTVNLASPVGSVLANIAGVDPDAGDSLSFSLVPGAVQNSSFSIVGNELRLATPLVAGKVYSVRIRVTDLLGLFIEKTFRLTVV